ncbi:MAG TPA: hypothetical protein VGA29_02875 [Ignavibacteriaceae bacterium]|jgi:hypothetical protein
MKTFNQKLQNLLKMGLLVTVILSFIACTEESDPMSPGLTNITGEWEGTLNHPGYDSGTLSLQLLQSNDNLSGSFTMRLVKNNNVQNYGGTITGAKISSNNYNLSLINSNFTWICDLNLNSTTLSGDWESSTSTISGSLSVQKN